MVDLNSLPNAHLKIIFAIHFFLCAWGIQGSWSPDSYFFYNLLFFITLMWAIQCKDASEPVEMALFIGVASIILDIIVITIYFPYQYSLNRFSVGMAILNLLVRPVTAMVLYRVHNERVGSSDGSFSNHLGGLFGATAQRGPYEDIDRVRDQPQRSQRGFDGGSPSLTRVCLVTDGADTKSPPAYHG